MRKRLLTFALCAAAACAMLAGCGGNVEKPADANQTAEAEKPLAQMSPDDEGFADYIRLDEQNRSQNDGTFLVQDGWIYGQSWDYNGHSQFIKTRTDMTDWTVLDTGYVTQMYLIDNYIYFMERSHTGDKYGIFRMKTSGEGKKLLVKAYGSMQVVGNHIYYTNSMKDGKYISKPKKDQVHLYRCNLNGKKKKEIIAKPTYFPFVFSDGILYQDDNDNESLHVCDLDGENDVKLNDAPSYNPVYDGEFIYYSREIKSGDKTKTVAYKIRPDGTDDTEVASYAITDTLLLKDDYIYFNYEDDSDRLYRMGKDGSNLTLITQDKRVGAVCLFDSMIKYSKYAKGYEYIEDNIFCELDGSGKRAFKKQ